MPKHTISAGGDMPGNKPDNAPDNNKPESEDCESDDECKRDGGDYR